MPVQSISESIKILSSVKNIRKVSSRIVNLLQDRGVTKDCIFDIRLCIEEATLNAIEHGNKMNESLSVDVTFSIDDEKIEVSVTDEGAGFSHKKLPDPTKDNNILRSHGRGVFLVYKLMDKVEYSDKGNKVNLVKYFFRRP